MKKEASVKTTGGLEIKFVRTAAKVDVYFIQPDGRVHLVGVVQQKIFFRAIVKLFSE